jgi:hypothetical protein
MATNDGAPTFGWTDEEKVLLHRTLRVRVLEEDRLEVETTHGTLLELFAVILLWIGLPVGAAATASVAATDVVAGYVYVTPLVFIALPFIALPLMAGFAHLVEEPPYPITFFPGTAWIVSHRPTQNAIGKIDPTQRERPTWNSSIYLATTIDSFALRTRIRASLRQRRRVQELLFARCASTATEDEPPKGVVDLVGRDAASLPSAFYAPLVRYTRLVSVTPDTLVVRNGKGPSLPWVILVVEFVIGLVAAMLYPFQILPNLFRLGDLSTLLYYPVFGAVLFLIAMIHSVFTYAHRRNHLMRTVTLNKQTSYLIYQDYLGECRIPTNECTMTIDVDPREKDDNEPAPDAMEICHGKKRLVKWILTNPQPSDEATRALDRGIREYLRAGGQRNRTRRGLDL